MAQGTPRWVGGSKSLSRFGARPRPQPRVRSSKIIQKYNNIVTS